MVKVKTVVRTVANVLPRRKKFNGPQRYILAVPGEVRGKGPEVTGTVPGARRRLINVIKEKLDLPNAGGLGTQLDIVAEVFVEAMTKGSYPHIKEFLDREEGKAAQRLSNADGTNIKIYAAMPLDDDKDAP